MTGLSPLEAQFSSLWDLVGGEHHHRFERRDCQTEARPEAGIGVGLLDRVVKHAGGDHVVGRPGVVEQAADLERVQDEWGAVRLASLACVSPFGVRERRHRFREAL